MIVVFVWYIINSFWEGLKFVGRSLHWWFILGMTTMWQFLLLRSN